MSLKFPFNNPKGWMKDLYFSLCSNLSIILFVVER